MSGSPGNSSLVQQFLAEHDAPCPGCGYNLRGVGGEMCPECSRPIVLTVQDGSPSRWSRRLLLAALWTWVITGGSSLAWNAYFVLFVVRSGGSGSLTMTLQYSAAAVFGGAQLSLSIAGLIRWRRGVRSGTTPVVFAWCVRLVLALVVAYAALLVLWQILYVLWALLGIW
jgi:hypothetical protein